MKGIINNRCNDKQKQYVKASLSNTSLSAIFSCMKKYFLNSGVLIQQYITNYFLIMNTKTVNYK